MKWMDQRDAGKQSEDLDQREAGSSIGTDERPWRKVRQVKGDP